MSSLQHRHDDHKEWEEIASPSRPTVATVIANMLLAPDSVQNGNVFACKKAVKDRSGRQLAHGHAFVCINIRATTNPSVSQFYKRFLLWQAGGYTSELYKACDSGLQTFIIEIFDYTVKSPHATSAYRRGSDGRYFVERVDKKTFEELHCPEGGFRVDRFQTMASFLVKCEDDDHVAIGEEVRVWQVNVLG